MAKKLSVSVVLIGLALFALLVNIFFIQRDNAEDFNKTVLSQRQSEYESRTIPYRRGDIYDRNGSRLATSERVYLLILDPAQMRDFEAVKADGTKTRNVIEPTIDALCEVFGFDRTELSQTIRDNANSQYLRFKKTVVNYDDKQRFLEYQAAKNDEYMASQDPVIGKNRIKGVWFEDNYRRTYPYGSLACNVIGVSSSDGSTGSGGVEQYYNETLTGINGREYGYLDDEANLEKVIRPAVNGDSLVLTIDATIQNIVQKYLEEWEHGEIGSKSAACVVMNPKNGEVLAMASTHDFDLNNPNTTGSYSQEEIYAFGINEAVAQYKLDHPDLTPITSAEVPEHYNREQIMKFGETIAMYQNWRNICVSDTYEPGSTQKIFTVAGALEENIIHENDSFRCDGNVQLSDGIHTWKINCVNRNGHGVLDVTGGITKSCNVVMMNIAFAEKAPTFVKYEKLFGFGGYTGIDLPAEANTEALGFASDQIGRTQLATNSFGQNFNCTMIQMAAAYCSVINGGYYYKPHVVKQILSADGALKEDVQPLVVRETVSSSTCDFIKHALVETVETGTGGAAKVAGFTVGGKTGTAQTQPRAAKQYVVSFCGFAPAEDPSLLCYVIVDRPNLPGEEAAHSSFASGIFSKIMAEALPAMNIYPEGGSAAGYQLPDTLLPGAEGDSHMAMGTDVNVEEESNADGGRTILTNSNGEPVYETVSPEEAAASQPAATDEFPEGEDDGGELPDTMESTAAQ